MTTPARRHEVVQGIDFGEFFFWDSEHPDEDDLTIDAITKAHSAGCSVACVDGAGVVLAPVQHGRTTVAVEVWDREPPLEDDAEDVVDLDWVADGDLVLEEPTAAATAVALPPGAYRLRVSGFGLTAALERGQEIARQGLTDDEDGLATPARWTFALWPRETEAPMKYHRAWRPYGRPDQPAPA